MGREMVVLYSGMGVGHLIPMTQLAMLLHRNGFSVTVVSADPPTKTGSGINLIPQISKQYQFISFQNLPAAVREDPNRHPMDLMFNAIRANNKILYNFLSSLASENSIKALVVDMFCTDALDVARRLGIPAYVHFPCSASVLAIYIYLPIYHTITHTSFKDMGNAFLDFPGVHPVPISDIPYTLQDRESEIYKARIKQFTQLAEADGILVNSFESLEKRAVEALKRGICLPGRKMPPIYCVGPLVTKYCNMKGLFEERHICLAWLDLQPKGSVIFLCFGSVVAFPADQIREIAIGLENSSHRFLWAVRSTDDKDKMFEPQIDTNLNSVLPEGFLDRTKTRGLVINSWAPQAEVLNHASVGAFLTHCGWNSTLEAIVAGVPMICWPVFTEQGLNKVLFCDEIMVGVAVKMSEEGFVRAEEVEAKVRWLMESEDGKMVRDCVLGVKEKAQEAMAENGSSIVAIVEFLRDLKLDEEVERSF